MHITCPECGFSRNVNEDKVPSSAEFASCPKCKARFKFRKVNDTTLADGQSDNGAKDAPAKSGHDIWEAVEKMHQSWEHKKQEHHPDDKAGDVEYENRDRENQQENTGQSDTSHHASHSMQVQETGTFFSNSGSVPWEHSTSFMRPIGFLRTVILPFINPAQFFGGISHAGSLIPALLFAFIMFCLQLAVSLTGLEVHVQDPLSNSIVTMPLTEIVNVPQLVTMAIFCFVAFQFFTSWLLNTLLKVAVSNRAKFNLTFKVTAYSFATSILYLIPQLGTLTSLLHMLFWFIGMRYAYKLSWREAALSVFPAVFGIFALIVLYAMQIMPPTA